MNKIRVAYSYDCLVSDKEDACTAGENKAELAEPPRVRSVKTGAVGVRLRERALLGGWREVVWRESRLSPH